MINQKTKSVLQKFSKIPLFEEHRAILIGGTVLAYHLGHRESSDLDPNYSEQVSDLPILISK